jgi:hypothetical protein
MNNWTLAQDLIAVIIILCVSAMGGTIAYVHEKGWRSLGNALLRFITAIVLLIAFLLALFLLVKFVKFSWYF